MQVMQGALCLLALCIFAPIAFAALTSISESGCSTKKSCFKKEGSCPTGSDCTYFASWKPVDTSKGKYLEIELTGPVQSSSGYIAIGFSTDNRMGDDGVVGCVASGAGAVTFQTAYNPGKYNEIIGTTPADFLITSDASAPNLLGGSFQASGNVLSCRFRRALKPASDEPKLKDLSSPNKFYVLLSRGSATSAAALGRHFDGGYAVSASSYDLASTEFIISGASRFNLVKAHAGLMMLAWLFFSAVGIIMARTAKPLWPEDSLCGQKVWFQIHRAMQVTCVLCTIVAFILIFVHVGGYSQIEALPGKAHPILGIIVTCLAIANPIIALFRPAPTAPKRPIFNWIHFGVGMLAQIFGLVAIYIGVNMPPAGAKFAAADYPLWILITYTIFYVIMDIILYINGRRITSRTQATEIDAEDKDIVKSAHKIQKLLIFIYIVVVGGLASALVILMAIN